MKPPMGTQPDVALQAQEPRSGLRKAAAAILAILLSAGTMLLLPGQVDWPPGAPGDASSADRSVDAQSVAVLYSSSLGGEMARTNLSWDWSIAGGHSEATIFGIATSEATHGSLVFGGPISRLLDQCFLNGQPVQPSAGLPAGLGFDPPQYANIWLDGRKAGTVSHIDFHGNSGPGGNVIRCDVRDFASDDQPVHRLYTPVLVAYVPGIEETSQQDLQLHQVCVEASFSSAVSRQEECADRFNPAPTLIDSVKLITLPEEQGVRDGRLILVGAVAGAAAAALLEALTGIGSILYRRLTRQAR